MTFLTGQVTLQLDILQKRIPYIDTVAKTNKTTVRQKKTENKYLKKYHKKP